MKKESKTTTIGTRDNESILSELEAQFDAKLKEVNDAFVKAADPVSLVEELGAIAEKYSVQKAHGIYMSCPDEVSLLKVHHFDTIVAKPVRAKGTTRIQGYSKDTRTIQLSMLDYCEYNNRDTVWFKKNVNALDKRMTLRAGLELGLSAERIAEIDGSFKMDALAKEIVIDKKTPCSNTQLTACINEIMSALGVTAKANNYDMNYILLTYSRKGKQVLSVRTATHSQLANLLMDVGHRLVTGGKYDVQA